MSAGPAVASPRFGRPLREFLATEAASGTVLLLAASVALVWANSPWSSAYEQLFGTEVAVGVGRWHLDLHLHEWINDGAMTLFFLVVGLEVKRELVHGELRDLRAAAVPLIGAAGGMLVPALIYAAINAGHPGSSGWGVPVATDIAFAVGVLALLGSRAPAGLKLLLLTLAVADDVGGIIVIAVAYASGLDGRFLVLAALALVATIPARRLNAAWLVVPLAIVAWLATHASGIHATISGVALAMLTPAHPASPGRVTTEWADELDRDPTTDELKQLWYLAQSALSPVERMQHRLHRYTGFLIAPLFALANVGVHLGDVSFDTPGATRVAIGAGVGLVVGKVVGVTLAMLLAVRLGIGRLPSDVTPRHVVGGGFVAGIGFTVALFMAGIAFDDDGLRMVATVAVLIGSVVSAVLATAWLTIASNAPSEVPAGR